MTRRVALVAFVAAVVLLATGTGAFTSVSADRGIDVAVVDDPNAFLGIRENAGSGWVGESYTVLHLSDNTGGGLDSVEIDGGGAAPVHLEEGATNGGLRDVEVTCDSEFEADVTLTIEATGPGISIVTDETVSVECEEPEVHGVRFDGCGNAFVRADPPLYPLHVTLVTQHSGPNGTTATSTTTATVDGPNDPTSGGSGRLVRALVDGERYENTNGCASAPDPANDDNPGKNPPARHDQPSTGVREGNT